MWGLCVRPSFSLLGDHLFIRAGGLRVERILEKESSDGGPSGAVINPGVAVGSSFNSLGPKSLISNGAGQNKNAF